MIYFLARCADQSLGTERARERLKNTSRAISLLSGGGRATGSMRERLLGSCASSSRRRNASSQPSEPTEKNPSTKYVDGEEVVKSTRKNGLPSWVGALAVSCSGLCWLDLPKGKTPVRHHLGRLTCLIRSSAQDLSALIKLKDHRQEKHPGPRPTARKNQPPGWFGSWVDAPLDAVH